MKLVTLLALAVGTLRGQTAPAQTASNPPAAVHRVQPEYSDAARAAHLQGTVTLYVETTPAGIPDHVNVLQGLGLGLDEKAIEAVKHWEFPPLVQNGVGYGAHRTVEVQFVTPGAVWRLARAAYSVPRPKGSRAEIVIVKPVLREYFAPSPEACKEASGAAPVEFTIGADGLPSGVRAFDPLHESGPVNVAISAAAVEAVQRWRFTPGKAAGKPAQANARVELECGGVVEASIGSQYRAGNGVTRPELVYKFETEYSEPARKAKLQGVVVLYVVVDATGHPTKIGVMRTMDKGLDEKAIEAVLQWRFRPGSKDGRPVNVAATIEVNFRLL
jgi:TonB family protein